MSSHGRYLPVFSSSSSLGFLIFQQSSPLFSWSSRTTWTPSFNAISAAYSFKQIGSPLLVSSRYSKYSVLLFLLGRPGGRNYSALFFSLITLFLSSISTSWFLNSGSKTNPIQTMKIRSTPLLVLFLFFYFCWNFSMSFFISARIFFICSLLWST